MRRRISKKGVKWIALWIATVLSEREYLNGVSFRQKKNSDSLANLELVFNRIPKLL